MASPGVLGETGKPSLELIGQRSTATLAPKGRGSGMRRAKPLSCWCLYMINGEVAERFKAAVLKTVDPQGSGGSNPSLSAIFLTRGMNPV
jgi:hypothetical protein